MDQLPARPSQRFNSIVTLIVCAVAVGVPLGIDRAWRRWWKQNRPIPSPVDGVERMAKTVRERRREIAHTGERVQLLVTEIIKATAVPPEDVET